MRVSVRVLAMILVVLMAAMPASAGTKADPEVVDRCDGQVQGSESSLAVTHESVDLCSVWFSTPETGVLDVSLSTQGDLEDRPGGYYIVYWTSGECRYGVTVDDGFDVEMPQYFTAYCGEQTTRTCPVPNIYVGCEEEGGPPKFALPDDAVTVSGNEMRIRVAFSGELAKYAEAHEKDSVLSDTEAWTSLAVGVAYMFTAGCTSNLEPGDYCFMANGDLAGNGRSYTVPK